jgi:hypothetical protein
MQKGYKTHSPHYPMGSVFWVPLHYQICSLSLLSSTNKFSTSKIFLNSAVTVCAFILRVGQEPWAPEIPVSVICASTVCPIKHLKSLMLSRARDSICNNTCPFA